MGGEYSTYGKELKCVHFSRKTWREETSWESKAWMWDNITMDLKRNWLPDIVDWILLVQNWVQVRFLANTVMNFRVP